VNKAAVCNVSFGAAATPGPLAVSTNSGGLTTFIYTPPIYQSAINLLTALGFEANWSNLAMVENATGDSTGIQASNFAGFQATGAAGLSGHLGMYVSGVPNGGVDATGWGGGWVEHGGGYGVTDTAGLLAPGTTVPGFRATDGAGGITGSYDASRLLPANQGLRFSGFFQYDRYDLSMPGFGSARTDEYRFGGSFLTTAARRT
jgi:hypothetical protein